MPSRDDSEVGPQPSFSDLVADLVMAAIATEGKSMREVSRLSGIPLTRLHDRLHRGHPFNTDELDQIADAIGVDPWALISKP